MRSLLAVLLFATSLSAQQKTFDLSGYVAGRGSDATGPSSWLQGGFGRMDVGGNREDYSAVAQLGLDWQPVQWLDVHVSGAARRDPGRKDAGVVEAFADVRKSFGNDEVRLRAGQFFLPTSRENEGELWTSPYSIHFSALNSWIAEEVRPVGAELSWAHTTGRGQIVSAGATAFRGNDTMGALLAWRGWSVGSRLSTYDEVLPLPPLEVLQTSFADQRDDGTKPFGSDLDGKNGYAARVRWTNPQRANVQYAYVDNRGDRALHRGEYAWATHFHLLSGEYGDPDDLSFAAEYLRGSTGMGVAPSFVQADFYAAYALVSERRGHSRWTVRYDLFRVLDTDRSAAGSNEDSGRSWTIAWLHDLFTNVRLGAEFTQVTGKRPALQESGVDPSLDGRALTLEVRYRF
ncbi:MAG TPA: hypothetical protein VF824_14510 [Thermoanaerobaculia bacterium]|jgi:hypothetical protein